MVPIIHQEGIRSWRPLKQNPNTLNNCESVLTVMHLYYDGVPHTALACTILYHVVLPFVLCSAIPCIINLFSTVHTVTVMEPLPR